MGWIEPALSLGLTGAGLLSGHGGKSLNIDAILNKWRNMQTLTPEDFKFASDQYQVGSEKVSQRRAGQRAMGAASLAAKGLTMSPVSERLTQEGESEDSTALTNLERERQATLFGIRTNRENQNLQYAMAEIAGKQYNLARRDASTAGWMNSLLEAAPNVFSYFRGLGGGGRSVPPNPDVAPPPDSWP